MVNNGQNLVSAVKEQPQKVFLYYALCFSVKNSTTSLIEKKRNTLKSNVVVFLNRGSLQSECSMLGTELNVQKNPLIEGIMLELISAL